MTHNASASTAALRHRLARSTVALAAAALAARPAAATVFTWSPGGSATTAGAAGGTGNWDASTYNWNVGGTANTVYASSNASGALFGGTGGVVTITAPVIANSLSFNAAGYSFANASGSTLTLASTAAGVAPTINTGGYNVTLGLGNAGLKLANNVVTKTGVGTLTLTNDQSGSIAAGAAWTVNGGTLLSSGVYSSAIALGDGKELGTSTGNVLNLDAGSLLFTATGGAGYYSARTINVSANGGAISDNGFAPGQGSVGNNGGNTISPVINIAAGAGLDLVSTNILDFDPGNNGAGAGVIGGAGGITVYGTGRTEILSTANTYSGGTTVTAGATLVIGGPKSLGTGGISVAGTLDLNNANLTVGRFAGGGTYDFNLSTGNATNTLAATSAAVSGTTTRLVLRAAAPSTFTAGQTYPVLTSTGGGLGSGSYAGSFLVPGGQDLTVPVSALIQNGQRLTITAAANTGGTAVNLITAATAAPAHTIAVMPLGSSISEGISAQSPYDGGGYRSQLYQNLANDGRFTPTFVGSATTTGANNPTSVDLTTTVGQNHHEGHSGYTTSQILNNLNGNDNSGGNDGGYWLAPGNGVNPDVITLNVGGNDYVYSNGTTTTAPDNLNQILTQIALLRPNATVIVSSLLYRGDGGGVAGSAAVAKYNPAVPGIVYQHTLAGQHVEYLDGYSLLTPNNSLALIGPDLIHPTQLGYDKYADGWYGAITTGQAFFTGAAGSTLTGTADGTTSWDLDYQRTTDAGVIPGPGTDVYFNGGGTGNTTLGADVSVRSVNFTAGATTPVTVGGTNTLTIGQGGITVQAGTAAHTISSAVNLAAAQTWANAATNRFTVSGPVGGTAALTLGGTGLVVVAGNSAFTGTPTAGTGVIVLSGSNTYSGGTTVAGGTLVAANTAGSATGTGPVTVAAGATLAGTGTVAGPVAVNGTVTAGLADGSIGNLSTGTQTWNSAGTFAAGLNAADTAVDRLILSGLTVASTASAPFVVNLTGTNAAAATGTYVLAVDKAATAGDPYGLTTAAVTLQVNGTTPPAAFTLSEGADTTGTGGFDLILSTTAAPEPTSLLLLCSTAVPLTLRRRGRRRPPTH